MKIPGKAEFALFFLCLVMAAGPVCAKKDQPAKVPKPDMTSRITKESLRILQTKIDDLIAKARQGRWRDFTAADRG